MAKTILLPQYNPSCKPAVQLLSNLEQPDYYNKTVTPGFAANREEVTKLLIEADGFYATGRYDLALKRYEQVLNIDPYNIAARKGMEAGWRPIETAPKKTWILTGMTGAPFLFILRQDHNGLWWTQNET